MRVICNSSPLILFSRAGLLDILKSLFDNLVIPEEVFNEVTRKGKLGEKIIKDADWITTVEVPKEDTIRKYYEKRFISSADPSVIALAKKENADLVLASFPSSNYS
ncbi:MAG: hypothetical protein E3J87_05990 [Candidatus Cloacimonadota bacterium]|nr:MAG: hypothetical protein E3J87_05990 [Candidatus Cloacimonadota bacterium]